MGGSWDERDLWEGFVGGSWDGEELGWEGIGKERVDRGESWDLIFTLLKLLKSSGNLKN